MGLSVAARGDPVEFDRSVQSLAHRAPAPEYSFE
jgi:hypothetical protein